MKRYCFVLDLIDDEKLIEEYEQMHKNVWKEIKQSIIDSGIVEMEIYRASNRLFMMLETTNDFSFENKMQLDSDNPKVQEWEQLMWKFQQPLPFAKPSEKWVLMNKIYSL
jgi:L-rhamnose mutarotase